MYGVSGTVMESACKSLQGSGELFFCHTLSSRVSLQ